MKQHAHEIDFTHSESITRKFGKSVREIGKIQSKGLYWKYVNRIFKEPTCIKSWRTKYDFELNDEEWDLIFKLPFTTTKDVRLREFQFKVLHRVYPTYSYIARFDKSVKELCITCNVKCDICHMFYCCKYVSQFWRELEQWFCNAIRPININLQHVIFGIKTENTFLENFCILHGKWFLHKGYKLHCNEKSYKPLFSHYVTYMKEVLKCEKQIIMNKVKEK